MTVKKGIVWKFGDDTNTDLIASGRYMNSSLEEMKKHVFELVCPRFSLEVRPGDFVVGGQNFGCGSSREEAPSVLKACGITAVIAESFARIFFRNAIAVGLPAVTCRGIADNLNSGDELEYDIDTASVTVLPAGKVLPCEILSPDIQEILDKGGILPVLKEFVSRQGC